MIFNIELVKQLKEMGFPYDWCDEDDCGENCLAKHQPFISEEEARLFILNANK